MNRLRPISSPPLRGPSRKEPPLTDSRSDERLRLAPLRSTSILGSHKRPSTPPKLRLAKPEPARILDFDVETVAAGFDDPNWVPQKITCVAWSWIGSEDIEVRISTSEGLFSRPERRRKMLAPLLEAIAEADMVTGHNLLRFDLPIVSAECMRLGLPTLGEVLVQDTMRLVRTKGFKKGQDNLSALVEVPEPKLTLSWQEWQLAYEEKGWETVKERCRSDVRAHKMMRERLLERGWLKPPRMWSP